MQTKTLYNTSAIIAIGLLSFCFFMKTIQAEERCTLDEKTIQLFAPGTDKSFLFCRTGEKTAITLKVNEKKPVGKFLALSSETFFLFIQILIMRFL